MSTYYSPGCNNEKAHVCNTCQVDDGRPVLSWPENDFDLCYVCLESLYIKHIDPKLKTLEEITVTRKSIPEKLRNEIFERDGNKCLVCGKNHHLEIDHIIPFSRGGKTEKSNLQTLCKPCNLSKRAA